MVAGMIEYNFGDSEVLTLFLFIVSAPYAFMQNRSAGSEVSRSNLESITLKRETGNRETGTFL